MKKILVAEDDQFLGNAYHSALTKAGFDVVLARDGIEALNALRVDTQIGLLLLDLVMPNKGGMETLRDIRRNPLTKELPVMVVSNLDRPENREEALAAGANDYFVKSNISIKELISRVKKII